MRKIKMRHDKLDKELKEKLGIKEITLGEFAGQVYQLQEYLTKRKNWEGLSVLNQLIPREVLETMVIQFVAAESFKDNLVKTPSGLAIRDIDVEEDKKK